MTFKLEPLPYGYDALEPFIDSKTMELHYSKHHQGYVDKLNAALEKYPELQAMAPEELIKDLKKIPAKARVAVRNQGGGHVNHSFFWQILKKGVEPKGELMNAIISQFGSIDKFKEEFAKASMGLFGSGWAWLVLDGKKLKLIATPNQDSPISEGLIPIVGLDLWEHAYYLKHQNRRADYISSFWNVLNWEKADEHYGQGMR